MPLQVAINTSCNKYGYEQTGAGTSMSRLGIADLGVATMNDMRDHAAMIASLDPNIPLIADADTGYGGKISTMTSRLGAHSSKDR